jgi:hypothetical protein
MGTSSRQVALGDHSGRPGAHPRFCTTRSPSDPLQPRCGCEAYACTLHAAAQAHVAGWQPAYTNSAPPQYARLRSSTSPSHCAAAKRRCTQHSAASPLTATMVHGGSMQHWQNPPLYGSIAARLLGIHERLCGAKLGRCCTGHRPCQHPLGNAAPDVPDLHRCCCCCCCCCVLKAREWESQGYWQPSQHTDGRGMALDTGDRSPVRGDAQGKGGTGAGPGVRGWMASSAEGAEMGLWLWALAITRLVLPLVWAGMRDLLVLALPCVGGCWRHLQPSTSPRLRAGWSDLDTGAG